MVKQRNIFLVYFFSIITIGIYYIYWLVKTKEELNQLGAEIPTAWLTIIPIANIYWLFQYASGYSKVKKEDNGVLWFLVFFFIGIAMPALVQSELNNHSK